MPRPSEGFVSQSFPLLLAKTGLAQDGAHDRDGNVAGVHGDRDTAAVRVCIAGVAPALPAE